MIDLASKLRVAIAIGILSFTALLSGSIAWKLQDTRIQKARNELVTYKMEIYKATIILQEEYNEKERLLQESVDVLLEDKNKKLNDITRRYNDAVTSLRNRPTRTEIITANPGDTEKGTGVGLSRDDAEFLTWYAAEANLVKEELLLCYKQYDEVRESYNKITREK
jgi:hypothetical protein